MSTPRVELDGIHGGDGDGHKMIKCSKLDKKVREEMRSKPEGKGIQIRVLFLPVEMQ
jgi:hypothetical protein